MNSGAAVVGGQRDEVYSLRQEGERDVLCTYGACVQTQTAVEKRGRFSIQKVSCASIRCEITTLCLGIILFLGGTVLFATSWAGCGVLGDHVDAGMRVGCMGACVGLSTAAVAATKCFRKCTSPSEEEEQGVSLTPV
jgi:hypothetical protein